MHLILMLWSGVVVHGYRGVKIYADSIANEGGERVSICQCQDTVVALRHVHGSPSMTIGAYSYRLTPLRLRVDLGHMVIGAK